FDPTSVADGLYDFRAIAHDGAGNPTASDPVNGRRIDNTPPTATLADPGSIVHGTVALGSSTDDMGGSGIASVAYQLSPAGAGTWSGIAASWNTAAGGDGLYDLRVVATDQAGNAGVSAERTNVRVDNTAPTVTPGCATGTWSSLGVATSSPWTAPWPLLDDGNRALRAIATDRAGRQSSAAVDVTVDRTPPDTSIGTKPGDPSSQAAPQFEFSA